MTKSLGLTLTIGILVLLGIAWFHSEEDQWRGFFYPNKNDLTDHDEVGLFASLEQCRFAAIAYGEDRGIQHTVYDYECGLNCRKDADFGDIYICEETFQ